jgi:hypothetical protein
VLEMLSPVRCGSEDWPFNRCPGWPTAPCTREAQRLVPGGRRFTDRAQRATVQIGPRGTAVDLRDLIGALPDPIGALVQRRHMRGTALARHYRSTSVRVHTSHRGQRRTGRSSSDQQRMIERVSVAPSF